jgi:hypothetical protein
VNDKYHEPDHDEGADDRRESAPVSHESMSGGRPALLAIAWTVVGIPLLYGIYQIALDTVELFG